MRILINVAAIGLMSLLAAARAQPRDPFAPEPDICITSLTQAEYRGYVATGDRFIALIARPQGQWQRWVIDSQPEPGWRVSYITADRLELSGPSSCPRIGLSRHRQGEIFRDETKHVLRATRAGDSAIRADAAR